MTAPAHKDGLSLGIDIGTSGVRTAVLDGSGAVISGARVAHTPQSGAKVDARGWWTAAARCIAMQAENLRNMGHSLKEVARIGVDGTSGTMVLTDAQLEPVGGALMYDTTGFASEAAVIARVAPPVHIARGSNSALARALRLTAADTDGDAVHLLHQADFIVANLLGRGGLSDHNNTLKLGFDPATGQWPDWFDRTGLDLRLLPEPLPAGVPIDTISPQVAQDFGFAPGTIIHAGTTDSIAAFLAAAPLELGAAVTSLGTTLAIKVLSDRRIDDPQIGLYSHRLGDFWLAGGASNTGGGVLAALFDANRLAELSADIDPATSSTADYYPLLKPGERFPVNDPALPPRMTPRPSDDAVFLKGLLEGIARIEAQCYRVVAQSGGPMPTQLFTAGGGATNAVWTDIRARVLGIRPQTAQQTEAAVGVARLVAGI